MIQQPIQELSELGPLPHDDADAQLIDHYADLLASISRPITDEEARLLVKLFGPSDCYGLAWTLVHVIETSPGWPLTDALQDSGNFWIQHLRKTAINSGFLREE